MIHKLLQFYDENYNIHKLIFEELRCSRKLQLRSLLIISSIILILTISVKTKTPWILMLVFIPQYIGYKLLMNEMIKLLSAKHNIPMNGKLFDFTALSKKKRRILERY